MQAKQLTIKFLEYNSESELVEYDIELIRRARLAGINAWAPYSDFHVGAAIELDNNEIITGNNQENAAYPSGICAERVALFYANSRFPEVFIKSIAVTASNRNGLVESPVTPCGACRQALLEAEIRFGKPIRIILEGRNKILEFEGIESLLPFSFNASALK